jgi:hypothetical protein
MLSVQPKWHSFASVNCEENVLTAGIVPHGLEDQRIRKEVGKALLLVRLS